MERVKYNEYADSSVSIRTLGDLRKVIEGQPDSLQVHLFRVGGDTVYHLEGGIFTQECIEHNGMRHEVTGLILQHEG